MSEITTIGLDLAKNVFQVHGVNEVGGEVTRKRVRRSQMLTFFAGLPPCLVGMEACATAHVAELMATVRNDEDQRVPDMARQVLRVIADGIGALDTQIAIIEARIMAWHKSNAISQRLATIPGIGPIIATPIAAHCP